MVTPEQARRLAGLIETDESVRGASPSGDPVAPLPDRIGNYRILGRLGHGGMGTVYRAEQSEPTRLVAVKLMHPGIASRTVMKRFAMEVEVLAHLQHPGIAQIFEAGTHDQGSGGVPFFAMEFVPNARPLTKHADDYGFSTRQRLKLFGQVCAAVHYGHQKGVIHRDLKPENILVGFDPQTGDPMDPMVKIIDFGIAKATNSDLSLTTIQADHASLTGTLQYMSPEQCNIGPGGSALELDTRADVYVLGMVLYELLSGELPYDVSQMPIPQAVYVVCHAEHPPPSQFHRSLRGNIDTIILKAIAHDRDARYGSVAALGDDINRHLNGTPIDARPPTHWTRAVHWVGRHPLVAFICAGLVLGGLTTASTTFVFSWLLNHRPYAVVRTESDHLARMVSVTGRELHVWDGNIAFAHLLDRPKLALVGFDSGVGPHPGSLCAFDLEGDLDTPIWSVTTKAEDFPPELASIPVKVSHFGSRAMGVFDVFPQLPGDEIVYSQVTDSSVAVLRVLDPRNGAILFQVWHDGHMGHFVWLEDLRRLVIGGYNTEVYWHERGAHDPGTHPRVVYAIEPQWNLISRQWIKTADDWGTFEPLWYRCLKNKDGKEWIKKTPLSPRMHYYPEDTAFAMELHMKDFGDAAVSMFFNADGEVIGRDAGNSYEGYLSRGEVPEVEWWEFGDLSPLVGERRLKMVETTHPW